MNPLKIARVLYMVKPQRLSRFWHRAEGGSLVEFALILPMMMMLITGMFSVGLVLNNYLMLTGSVDAAARAIAMASQLSNITDPCNYAVTQAANNAPSLNQSAVKWTIVWTPYTSGTAGTPSTLVSSAAASAATCSGAGKNFTTGDSLAVTATYPVSFIFYGWAPSTLNVTARTAELAQ